jgi:hypothetical protein
MADRLDGGSADREREGSIGRGAKMLRRLMSVLMVTLAVAGGRAAVAETRLLMLDQPACEWCARWDAEVGAVYARTAEGEQAPLIRADIHGPLPEGIALARGARFTPTFVLLENGIEVDRIEGYPGEEFFYGLLQRMLARRDRPAS